ncbi:MAG TPA: NHLP bacteriocin export ABC transporter permease/ATPase subunit [Acidimicrobiales bacterium]
MSALVSEPQAADPLVSAWTSVATALGQPVGPTDGLADGDVHERLTALAGRARLRVRRVALVGPWWGRDSGPLIGFRRDGGEPVALFPRPWGGYTMVEGDRAPARVTPEGARQLASHGYAVYRSFPPRPMRLTDVVRFATRPLRADLALLTVAGLAASAVVALVAVAGGRLVDDVLPADDGGVFLAFGAALLVSTLALGLVEAVRAVALVRVAGSMRLALQAAVWDRLLTVRASFFGRYPTGDLAARASGIDVLEQLVAGPAVAAGVGLLTSAASWLVLVSIDPLLALLAAALAVVFAGLAAAVHVRTHRDRRVLLGIHGQLASLVFQLLNGIAKLKVAAAEGRAFAVWRAKFDAQHRLAARIERRILVLQTMAGAGPTLVLLAVVAVLAESRRLSVGEFVSFGAALSVVMSALVEATLAAPSFLHATSVFERVHPILDEAPEVPPGRRLPPPLTGAVAVRDVSFRYAPGGPLVLDRVSLEARPGQFVAIVGPSGSGKSTLLRLLLGFEQPGEGTVAYDGHPLDELDTAAVRRQLGVVLQDALLLPGATLFENIAGSRRCTLDDAWAAATAAGLADDIRAMPMGMHTFVAEGASTFSGGQRQRLLIARALLSRPRVLLLDEATSALDNRTQEQVAASVEALRLTRIVIAHRLSTIARADVIYVMSGGRVVQQGNLSELMAVAGPFRDLALPQMT